LAADKQNQSRRCARKRLGYPQWNIFYYMKTSGRRGAGGGVQHPTIQWAKGAWIGGNRKGFNFLQSEDTRRRIGGSIQTAKGKKMAATIGVEEARSFVPGESKLRSFILTKSGRCGEERTCQSVGRWVTTGLFQTLIPGPDNEKVNRHEGGLKDGFCGQVVGETRVPWRAKVGRADNEDATQSRSVANNGPKAQSETSWGRLSRKTSIRRDDF